MLMAIKLDVYISYVLISCRVCTFEEKLQTKAASVSIIVGKNSDCFNL